MRPVKLRVHTRENGPRGGADSRIDDFTVSLPGDTTLDAATARVQEALDKRFGEGARVAVAVRLYPHWNKDDGNER